MKFVQVNANDLKSRSYGSHDLHLALRARGFDSRQMVVERQSSDARTELIVPPVIGGAAYRMAHALEAALSLQSMLYPFSWTLPFRRSFRTADLVHYHLIHAQWFSLPSLPWLTRTKPSVWTLHDPWALTGRCVHPMSCDGWLSGCGRCPTLSNQIPMRRDRSAHMYRRKSEIYARANFDLIVGSPWMAERVRLSPLLSSKRLHVIPFGVDLNLFRPGARASAKRALGLPEHAVVLAVRATSNAHKGFDRLERALEIISMGRPPGREIALLAFDEKGRLERLRGRFPIVETGLLLERAAYAQALRAADIFVAPSRNESFGMMALEAMACGAACVVTEGTALETTIQAPRAGICVPADEDGQALATAIAGLVADPSARERLGAAGRRIAENEHGMETYLDRILAVYRGKIEERGLERRE